MTQYESIIMLQSQLKQNQLECILKEIEKIINDIGKLTKIENLGLKKLAYEVKKNKEAYYILSEFEIDDNDKGVTSKLEKYYRITDEVLKFIIVKRD